MYRLDQKMGIIYFFFLHCDLGKDAADVVLNAGIRGSDQSKADLINLMPISLWERVLPVLERLSPYEYEPWTEEWVGKVFDFIFPMGVSAKPYG